MDKIETPEDEEILKFLNDLADYCIPMDGGKMRMKAQVWPIVKARDASIAAQTRAEDAERAVRWVNKNLADEHMPLLYKRLEEGELRLAITQSPLQCLPEGRGGYEMTREERIEADDDVVIPMEIRSTGMVLVSQKELLALREKVERQKWISVKERLPETLIAVLIRYTSIHGKPHTTIAQYTAPKTVLEEDFLDENAEGCSEYDEEKDCYWVVEGWWENSYESETNWRLAGTITHWMPLPEPPAIMAEPETRR